MLDLGMRSIIRFAVVFALVSVAALVAITVFEVEFGTTDYWSLHGMALLIGLALLPRLTLLVSSIATGGILWWLGWIFAPRILIALFATVAYFKVNPVLVVIAWLIALGGESTEKHYWWRRRIPTPDGKSD